MFNDFKAKSRVKWFFESGVDAAHVGLHITKEVVEGQRASKPIQVDSYLGATSEI